MEKMYFKVPVLLCKKIRRVFCRDKHVCQEDCTKEGANNLQRFSLCSLMSLCRDFTVELLWVSQKVELMKLMHWWKVARISQVFCVIDRLSFYWRSKTSTWGFVALPPAAIFLARVRIGKCA